MRGASRIEAPWLLCAPEIMIYVLADRVLLKDDELLSKLLLATPFPRSVRRLLRKGFFGRSWQQVESCDYWLASDGVVAILFRICGATAAQIFAIRMRFDERAVRHPGLELTRELLLEIVTFVTGVSPSQSHK
jgi:hypothetical protein